MSTHLGGENIMECVRNVIGRTDVLVAEILTTHAAGTHNWGSNKLVV